MNTFYVYEHWRSDTNQCFYVGKGHGKRAYDFNGRTKYHRHVREKLGRAGFTIVVKIVAVGLSEADAFKREAAAILHHRVNGAILVNLTDGGEGASGAKRSRETRDKQSAKAKLRRHSEETKQKLRGVVWTDERRAKISASQSGKKRGSLSEERRANISQALRGKPGRPMSEANKIAISEANKGKRRSPEQCDNISRGKLAAFERSGRLRKIRERVPQEVRSEKARKIALCEENMGRWRDCSKLGPAAQAKPVICISDGNEFESASAAARNYGVQKSSIIELCLGNPRRKSVGGLKFAYKDCQDGVRVEIGASSNESASASSFCCM